MQITNVDPMYLPLTIALGAFIAFAPLAAVTTRRRNERDGAASKLLEQKAAARGWRFGLQSNDRTVPTGLHRFYNGYRTKWRISGTRRGQMWILESTVERDHRGGVPNVANFRALLGSPEQYALQIAVPTRKQPPFTLPAAMFPKNVAESRVRTFNMRDMADFGPMRPLEVPDLLRAAGYVAGTRGVDSDRTRAVIDLVTPVLAAWHEKIPDAPLAIQVFGPVVQVGVVRRLEDFTEIERVIDLGLAVLDVMEPA